MGNEEGPRNCTYAPVPQLSLQDPPRIYYYPATNILAETLLIFTRKITICKNLAPLIFLWTLFSFLVDREECQVFLIINYALY